MPKAVALGIKLFGRFFFKSYPFEEAFLRDYARQLRAWLEHYPREQLHVVLSERLFNFFRANI